MTEVYFYANFSTSYSTRIYERGVCSLNDWDSVCTHCQITAHKKINCMCLFITAWIQSGKTQLLQ